MYNRATPNEMMKYKLFIRPLFEIEDLVTYADDNYMGEEHKCIKEAISKIIEKTERVMRWMSSSGLKINESKTEICIFHRSQTITMDVIIDNTSLTSKDTINILGIVFDCNLKWNQHYSKTLLLGT